MPNSLFSFSFEQVIQHIELEKRQSASKFFIQHNTVTPLSLHYTTSDLNPLQPESHHALLHFMYPPAVSNEVSEG